MLCMRGLGFHKYRLPWKSKSLILKNDTWVKITTLSEMMYCELGIFTLYVTHYVRIIKYWLQIVKWSKSTYEENV